MTDAAVTFETEPPPSPSAKKPLAGRKILIIVENLPVPFDRRVWQESLALVAAGRARLGQRLYVPMPGRDVEVEVTSPIFYDPKGERLNG